MDDDSPNVTVKFQLNNFQTIAQTYGKDLSVADVKEDLAKKFKVPGRFLRFQQGKCPILNDTRLFELEQNDFFIIEIDLGLTPEAVRINEEALNKSQVISLDADVFYSHYHLPEFFAVQIGTDADTDEVAKQIIVEVINRPMIKPFLGGYLNKQTSIELHDALTQTGPSNESIKWNGVFSRDTQTAEMRNTSDDTHYDRSNQAFGSATELIYIPSTTDVIIYARKYETYAEMVKRINKIGKIKLIQRNFRRYMWQKLIRESAAEWRRLVAEQASREAARHEKYVNIFKRECTVKTFPKTRNDFNVLYVQLNLWKQSELKRINEMYSGGPRIAEIHGLLDKEIQLLNAIERKWFAMRKDLAALKAEKDLDLMGAPIKWVTYKNITAEMDLLRTQKIRYLTKIYREMKAMPKSTEERLQLITRVAELFTNEYNEQPSKCVDDLLQLIDREKTLLALHLKGDTTETLRQREIVLFLEFIQTMGTTGELQQSKIDGVDATRLLCKQCKSVKNIADFELHTRQAGVNVCLTCTLLKVPPVDVSLYRAILRSIQRDERKRASLASYAFIVQEEDIREIVEVIWHGHSILSQCDIRKELQLPRWNRGDDWAPWNCVCLTHDEARAHLKINNLEGLYETYVLQDIYKKHIQAKLMFQKLISVNEDFVETGEWWQIGLKKKMNKK